MIWVDLASCSPPSQSQATSQSTAAQKDDKYYHVGSHLPSKDPGKNVNDKLGDKVDTYNDYLRRPLPPTSN